MKSNTANPPPRLFAAGRSLQTEFTYAKSRYNKAGNEFMLEVISKESKDFDNWAEDVFLFFEGDSRSIDEYFKRRGADGESSIRLFELALVTMKEEMERLNTLCAEDLRRRDEPDQQAITARVKELVESIEEKGESLIEMADKLVEV